MLILRPEKFGGIIFNTLNAHELWLDKKLFSEVLEFLENKTQNKNNSLKVNQVFNELEVKNFRYIFLSPAEKMDLKIYDFTVLNSPVLLDINITQKCNLNCPHCYVDSRRDGREMSEKEFDLILKQCKDLGVVQVAIGGGEPATHPLFSKFLKKTRTANVVPNVTSNGRELSWRTVYSMARYAGAVALSIEQVGDKFKKRRGFEFQDFLKSVKKLKAAGIKLVFQIVISKGNLADLNKTVRELLKYKPYGFLFLAYKPQGRGINYDSPLSKVNHQKVKKILGDILKNLNGKVKIGFDCCLTPALIGFENNSFVGCSAGRTSAAIMPDLRMIPCSFLNAEKDQENLKDKSIMEIWQGNYFNNFRQKIVNNMNNEICKDCPTKNVCFGGCPIFKLVNCSRDKS